MLGSSCGASYDSINDRYFGLEPDGDVLNPNVAGDIDVAYDNAGKFPGPATSGPLPRTAVVTMGSVPCANGLQPTPLCQPAPTLTVTGR